MTMQLISHHTSNGQRMALVVKTGRKWLKVFYVGATRLKRVSITERKHFREHGNATRRQIKQFNDCAKRFGAIKNVVKYQ